MKWLLVVLVMNSPVKTDLSFDNLDACLVAEQDMRSEWTKIYNRAHAKQAEKATLDFIMSQMTMGTCIPTAPHDNDGRLGLTGADAQRPQSPPYPVGR